MPDAAEPRTNQVSGHSSHSSYVDVGNLSTMHESSNFLELPTERHNRQAIAPFHSFHAAVASANQFEQGDDNAVAIEHHQAGSAESVIHTDCVTTIHNYSYNIQASDMGNEVDMAPMLQNFQDETNPTDGRLYGWFSNPEDDSANSGEMILSEELKSTENQMEDAPTWDYFQGIGAWASFPVQGSTEQCEDVIELEICEYDMLNPKEYQEYREMENQ